LRRFLLIWFGLLALSYGVWALRAERGFAPAQTAAEAAGLRVFAARVVKESATGPVREERRTPLAYQFITAEGAPNGSAGAAAARVPVLLLHGSPGSHADFRDLAPRLDGRTLIAPDLPGFGCSRTAGPFAASLPSYSVRAHADYALQLLDELGVARAHLVGFSMGGGVALELAQRAPERAASLVLLSSIGVQELELFGSYEMNHLVHLGQLGALRFARDLLPHFGALDGAFFGVEYARNFTDTDQRPLRAALLGWDGPALILHGERDFLVPAAAALEHARLMPQAELRVLESASHFLPWLQTEETAAAMQSFFDAAERGAAPTRATASAAAREAAFAPFDPAGIPPFTGFALALAFLLLAAATLVSEDLTCIGAGVLVSQGRIEFVPAVAACFAGIFVGDMLLYFAGRLVGARALERAPLRWMLTPGAVARAREGFRRRGLAVIFLSRFMPGLRLPTYFAAGVLKVGALRFATFFILAGLAWTPALVGVAALTGREAGDLVKDFGRWAPWAAVGLILTLFLIVRVGVPALTWRGRRLLLGAWRRKRRWEYWPRWIFYPPIALFGVLPAALRRRSLRIVTAVNPGMFSGGLVGESKSAILDALAGGSGAPEVARHLLLAPGAPAERLVRARAAVPDWPLVLKPDVGERGRGVVIARDEAAALAALAAHPGPLIAQEYVPGIEFGVFYARAPGAARGRVLSVARKDLPEVIGDGDRTLERLILSHPRHVNMGSWFLELHAARLTEVPAAGERVVLSPLGTHARGATFVDARALITPELEEAIERISRRCEGFRFGRYDLRVPSESDLRAGRHLRVLELNGLTSEQAHVYDPSASLFAAWRTLIAQWRLAYAIAAEEVAAGARPSSWEEIRAAFRRHRDA
jgi:pimeloyl-ACP methyl ester carboxylesterase/membrane protein DedA with SNARE-associated domain